MVDLPQLDRIRDTLAEQWDRALDRTVRVAVTGLSQSGKTVFITSLINQLLNPERLPHLQAAAEERILASRLQTLPELRVPEFPYAENIAAMSGASPHWPAPTDRVRAARVALRARIQRRLLPDSEQTIYVDIIDYPGEWLLDLPLLELSYEQWSRQVQVQCEQEPRRSLAREWLDFVASVDPAAAVDEELIRRGQALYVDFLQRCKNSEHVLSYLQPGRFVLPGDLAGAPILAFFPLPSSDAAKYDKHSLHTTLRARYEAYKEQVVRRFYKEEFSRFDRQIVLVDVLKALHHGPATFRDMQEAIGVVLQSFNYGKSGLLNRLFKNKIDKLLFAATKADHVADNQHTALRMLLESLVSDAARELRFQGIDLATLAIASVRCTRTVGAQVQGRTLSCLEGVTKDSDRSRILFPGEVPEAVPSEDAWGRDRFNFLEYRLPRFEALERSALPHIRLDQALQFLIGDKLA